VLWEWHTHVPLQRREAWRRDPKALSTIEAALTMEAVLTMEAALTRP
jgi:hypothetical protein